MPIRRQIFETFEIGQIDPVGSCYKVVFLAFFRQNLIGFVSQQDAGNRFAVDLEPQNGAASGIIPAGTDIISVKLQNGNGSPDVVVIKNKIGFSFLFII